jgi:hypothetical protein
MVTPATQKSLGTATPQRQASSSQSGKSAPSAATGTDGKVTTSSSSRNSSFQADVSESKIKNTVNAQSNVVSPHDKTSGENPADGERQKDLR